jgi:hypothetical protein
VLVVVVLVVMVLVVIGHPGPVGAKYVDEGKSSKVYVPTGGFVIVIVSGPDSVPHPVPVEPEKEAPSDKGRVFIPAVHGSEMQPILPSGVIK